MGLFAALITALFCFRVDFRMVLQKFGKICSSLATKRTDKRQVVDVLLVMTTCLILVLEFVVTENAKVFDILFFP